jgi:hypothetical protein
VNRAVSGKNGRSHRRVVHAGNGQAHDDGGNELLPEIRLQMQPATSLGRRQKPDVGRHSQMTWFPNIQNIQDAPLALCWQDGE